MENGYNNFFKKMLKLATSGFIDLKGANDKKEEMDLALALISKKTFVVPETAFKNTFFIPYSDN